MDDNENEYVYVVSERLHGEPKAFMAVGATLKAGQRIATHSHRFPLMWHSDHDGGSYADTGYGRYEVAKRLVYREES